MTSELCSLLVHSISSSLTQYKIMWPKGGRVEMEEFLEKVPRAFSKVTDLLVASPKSGSHTCNFNWHFMVPDSNFSVRCNNA